LPNTFSQFLENSGLGPERTIGPLMETRSFLTLLQNAARCRAEISAYRRILKAAFDVASSVCRSTNAVAKAAWLTISARGP
jgi:hypothetical protein